MRMPNKCLPPWTRVSMNKSDQGENPYWRWSSFIPHRSLPVGFYPLFRITHHTHNMIFHTHKLQNQIIFSPFSQFLYLRFGKRGSNDEALRFLANMDQSYNGQVRPRCNIFIKHLKIQSICYQNCEVWIGQVYWNWFDWMKWMFFSAVW